jgi:hypothetical protein
MTFGSSRLLSRDVIVFPIHNDIMTQIPFWTGFHCLLSEKRLDITVVAHRPMIDAKTDRHVRSTHGYEKRSCYVNGRWPRACNPSI